MKITILTILALSSSLSHAGTIEEVKKANCVSDRGSYLRLDRAKNVLEAKFADLRPMTNSSEGESSPIEVSPNFRGTNKSLIGALVADDQFYWGSISLVEEGGKQISSKSSLMALFLDAAGSSQKEILECELEF